MYESTVYPGVTEEVCVPILEKESGMQCGQDFKSRLDRLAVEESGLVYWAL